MHLAGQKVADYPRCGKVLDPGDNSSGFHWGHATLLRNMTNSTQLSRPEFNKVRSCGAAELLQKVNVSSSPASVKWNPRRNSRQSWSPANSVNPPPNGFSLKKSSKTAGSCARPARQCAYAMVKWYRSVRSGGTRSRKDRSASPRVSAAMFSWNTEVVWDLECADRRPSVRRFRLSNIPQVGRGGVCVCAIPEGKKAKPLEKSRLFPFTGSNSEPRQEIKKTVFLLSGNCQ